MAGGVSSGVSVMSAMNAPGAGPHVPFWAQLLPRATRLVRVSAATAFGVHNRRLVLSGGCSFQDNDKLDFAVDTAHYPDGTRATEPTISAAAPGSKRGFQPLTRRTVA